MKKISLNQNWQFAKGTITMMESMMGEAGNIENIDLPHDAMIYQERTPATANAHQTGFYPGGEYTYMKKWEIPDGKISENRFARADLEHILLCVDDDMRMEALRQTNYVKSIVTAQGKMDLERKGKQSYQGSVSYTHLLVGLTRLLVLRHGAAPPFPDV